MGWFYESHIVCDLSKIARLGPFSAVISPADLTVFHDFLRLFGSKF
jgi:hypothetical protein